MSKSCGEGLGLRQDLAHSLAGLTELETRGEQITCKSSNSGKKAGRADELG